MRAAEVAKKNSNDANTSYATSEREECTSERERQRETERLRDRERLRETETERERERKGEKGEKE
jgi:hypothetical protein